MAYVSLCFNRKISNAILLQRNNSLNFDRTIISLWKKLRNIMRVIFCNDNHRFSSRATDKYVHRLDYLVKIISQYIHQPRTRANNNDTYTRTARERERATAGKSLQRERNARSRSGISWIMSVNEKIQHAIVKRFVESKAAAAAASRGARQK